MLKLNVCILFQDWIVSAQSFINKLWPGILEEEEIIDISEVPAVKWGREHEKDGADSYNATHSDKITECGIFVSKAKPFLAASPDRLDLKNEMVIEIKCPYNRRGVDPKVNIPDYCYRDEQSGLIKLNKDHQYYMQIMCQMYVLGWKKGRFVVQVSIYIQSIQ